jgi:membrane-associated protease RseP (regulator of RpoE activity)
LRQSCCCLNLVAHEAAHAIAMRRIGVSITSAGLGFGKPRWRVYQRQLPDGRQLQLYLSPWLVGAWIRYEENDYKTIEQSPYRDFAWGMGAGIVVNLVAGGALWMAAYLLDGEWTAAAITAAVTLAVWLLRRPFAAYALPVLAPASVVVFVQGMLQTLGEQTGPAATVQLLSSGSLAHALDISGTIALGLAALNMLPFTPLDGARIVHRIVGHWLSERAMLAIEWTGLIAVATISVYAVLSDVLFA